MAIITFADIYKAAISRAREKTTDTTLLGYVKDWINFRYKEVCSLADWPFLHDLTIIRLLDEYDDEDIDITEDTSAVTGNSTVWTKDMTLRKIKFDGWGEIFTVARVSSATSITLDGTYHGDDIDDGGYTVFQDVYACPFTWDDIVRIRDTEAGRDLERKMLREMMEENPNPYPTSSDPTAYAIQPMRRYTKITVDGYNGANTIANISVDQWFLAGTSAAYGWVKAKGTDADSNDYLILDILYGTLQDNETLTFYSDVETTATTVTCTVDEASGYTEGNVGDNLVIRFDPPPYQNKMYDVDVTLKTVDLVQTYDLPHIPEKFRDILFYFALADIRDYRGKTEDASKWEAKAIIRLNQMMAHYKIKKMDRPRIRPPYARVSYG